jgi:TonB family protein
MYFNLEDRSFETPTIESAMSWREQALLSLFFHLALAALVLIVPRLSFVQEAAERRAERLRETAAAAELQAQLQQELRPDDSRTFVFIQPRIEIDPPEAPPPEAVLSDRDRVAQSPVRTFDPENRLPVAEGNSPEFIVAPEAPEDEGLDAADVEGREDGADGVEGDEGADALDEPRLADASAGQGEEIETQDEVADDPGSVPDADDADGPALLDSLLAEAGAGPGDPDAADERRIDLTPDGLFGRQVENLRQRVRRETFRNYSGDTGRYGPEIQFDSKGVEFGPWLRRFVAQIRRNWFVPYAIWSMHGHVVLTFNVHSDGSLTDLTVVRPSLVEAFTNSAFNALRSSNPTQPLPPEYPDDHAFFTVIFYFNEVPPA